MSFTSFIKKLFGDKSQRDLKAIKPIVDKIKASKNAWRIPEATLFLVALLGGSLGSLLGMYTFRHKTKHISFSFGMPLILAAQIVVIVLIMDHL